jgi:hypothetical protein
MVYEDLYKQANLKEGVGNRANHPVIRKQKLERAIQKAVMAAVGKWQDEQQAFGREGEELADEIKEVVGRTSIPFHPNSRPGSW